MDTLEPFEFMDRSDIVAFHKFVKRIYFEVNDGIAQKQPAL